METVQRFITTDLGEKVRVNNTAIYLAPDDNAKMYADAGKRATPYPNSGVPMWGRLRT